ncbi:MAG TPA: GAF domain-containing SpoIIE family protein phosphatase [Bacteroidota bacterium]|nr:GAF domain-containing SpoIIE family protein phosphatase [Bacteroidota bacterium]
MQIQRLESLIEASKMLNSTLNLNKLLKLILDLATQNLHAERGTIYLVDHERKELWSKVLKGKELVEIRLPIGTGISGHVAKTGKTVNLEDAWKDKRFYSGYDMRSGFKTKSMLCMALKNREGKIIGVFQIINKMSGFFNEADERFLEAFSDHVALAIENAQLHEAMLEKERMEKEIEIAARIQQALLPKQLPKIPMYDLDAAAFPCKSVGGDYYDIIQLDPHRYVMVVADVSGKGVPAALLVSTLQASLHAYIQMGGELDELVRRLNSVVFKNTSSERFITLFASVLDTRNHLLSYVNAGHNYPVWVNEKQREAKFGLSEGGIPLGMLPNAKYEIASTPVRPQDLLVFYTDGVTEAKNRSFRDYGEERLKVCVEQSVDLDASAVKSRIVDDIRRFTGPEQQSDDLTLVVLKRRGSDPVN